jgi:ribosomal protein L23
MAQRVFSSPALVRAMEKIYGSKVKTVKISLRYGRSVNAYIRKIEEGHKKAAESTLRFD